MKPNIILLGALTEKLGLKFKFRLYYYLVAKNANIYILWFISKPKYLLDTGLGIWNLHFRHC